MPTFPSSHHPLPPTSSPARPPAVLPTLLSPARQQARKQAYVHASRACARLSAYTPILPATSPGTPSIQPPVRQTTHSFACPLTQAIRPSACLTARTSGTFAHPTHKLIDASLACFGRGARARLLPVRCVRTAVAVQDPRRQTCQLRSWLAGWLAAPPCQATQQSGRFIGCTCKRKG